MVSNYITSNENIPTPILKLAEEISEKMPDDTPLTYHSCITFSKKHYEGPFYIAQKNELLSEENRIIVDNLTEAFLILKGIDISKVLPEVKINIAMVKPNADTINDVASFLNGIILADNKISGINGIRFGSSKHLATLLLSLKKPLKINAIMNIAYHKNITKLDFSSSFLTKDYELQNQKQQTDILFHKGDFGIEPCAYIIGEDAVDVAQKAKKILETIS
jgi:predicted fused transcriptional regulator/phosphomethylpyrimidine kinase